MDLNVIYDAIVPYNIKDIPLVKSSLKIFIESLNRNAQIAQRIQKLYSVDDETWYKLDDNGDPIVVNDSSFLKTSKDNLKKGLLLTYINTLYNAIGSAQTNNLIREATKIRNYKDSLIYKEQHDILTSEFFGSFRGVQQSIGTLNAFNYMYQFSKYLETGYLQNDLNTNSKEPSNFVMNYEGSLHKYYFTDFLHDLAHPIGWTYTYTTMLKMMLEDYFGIAYQYRLPRICVKNANDKYIFFTELNKTEFLNTLREAIKSDETRSNTIWMEGPLYYDQNETLSREIYFKKIEEFNFLELDELDTSKIDDGTYFADADVLLVHYSYTRYNYYNENNENRISLVSFSNNKCLYFDNDNVYFGQINNSYDGQQYTDELYKFASYFDLDCGSTKEINDNTFYEFLYYDDVSWMFDWELTYCKNKYLSPDRDYQFKLVGPQLIYTQGYDESKCNLNLTKNNKTVNRSNLRSFDNNFNMYFSFKNNQETYIDVRTDFGERWTYVYTNIGENTAKISTSGFRGKYITIRAMTVDSDVYIKTNLNNINPNTYIYNWTYDDTSNIVKIYAKTNKNTVYFIYSGVIHTITPNNGNIEITLNCNNVLEFILDDVYVKTTLFIHNYYNTELQMPLYKDYKDFDYNIEVTNLISPDYMIDEPKVSSNYKSLGVQNLTPECEIDTIESENLDDYTDSKYPQNQTYIYKGYKWVNCDTSEVYVMDSTKYVVDDITFRSLGGCMLVFNDNNQGDSFTDYDDMKRHSFNGAIDWNYKHSFIFTIESQMYPEVIDRASWKRVNHYLVTKENI